MKNSKKRPENIILSYDTDINTTDRFSVTVWKSNSPTLVLTTRKMAEKRCNSLIKFSKRVEVTPSYFNRIADREGVEFPSEVENVNRACGFLHARAKL
jgi:hypothetical protein